MLDGALVSLRAVRPDDLPLLFEIFADLQTWEERSPQLPGPATYEQFLARIAARDDADVVQFAIAAAGELVGQCVLMHEDPLARTAEVGLGLADGARGKGYGTDALRVLCEFAFTRRNLRRLHLIVLATNEAAIASYRKVGFVAEGRRREHCWVRGRYVDEVLMGLLRRDWPVVSATSLQRGSV